jgi:hypothetical protein
MSQGLPVTDELRFTIMLAGVHWLNVRVITAGENPSLLMPSTSSEIAGWLVCQGPGPVPSDRDENPKMTCPTIVPPFGPIASSPLPVIR